MPDTPDTIDSSSEVGIGAEDPTRRIESVVEAAVAPLESQVIPAKPKRRISPLGFSSLVIIISSIIFLVFLLFGGK